MRRKNVVGANMSEETDMKALKRFGQTECLSLER